MKDLSNENVIHKVKNGIEYLQFRRLLEYKNISHMYVLKNGDLNFKIVNEDKEELINNYKSVCGLEGMDYKNVIRPTQKHTDNIKCVSKKILDDEPDMYIDELDDLDGVITNEKGYVLSTTNADCILIIMYDTKKNVICNVHSGWKGTFQCIAKKAIEKMVENYDCDPKDIICCMSPSIAKCHFEVEQDVKDICESIFSYTGRLGEIIEDYGKINGVQKYHIDTVLINKIILQEAGVLEENIIASNICSMCNSEHVHSRRAEGPDYKVSTMLIGLNKT